MSYNYLPLDRKWLHFQQVKNLLDYDQLVSITFDAHERILKCNEYLASTQYFNQDLPQAQKVGEDLLSKYTYEPIPLDVVKLVLMLKIKSLSYGHSGVQIETVKRLMEMYNNDTFPVIYNKSSNGIEAGSDLIYLSQALLGEGEVNFKGQERQAAEVLEELNWRPLQLRNEELAALSTGTQVTTAFGLLGLIRTEQLLKMATVIAAMSIEAFAIGKEFLEPEIQIASHKGQVETASTILRYLRAGELPQSRLATSQQDYSFSNIPRILGSVKDAFDYVKEIFVREVNSVTESMTVFPDKNLVLNNGNVNREALNIALSFLINNINVLISSSTEVTKELLEGIDSLTFAGEQDTEANSEFHGLTKTVLDFSEGIRALFTVVDNKYSVTSARVRPFNDEVTYGTELLATIEKAEKVLSLELLSAARALDYRKSSDLPTFISTVLSDFHSGVLFTGDYSLLFKDISKTVEFVTSYNLEVE